MTLEEKKDGELARTASAGVASVDMLDNGSIKRELKPRHSQMIALGGCVGMSVTICKVPL